jgi:hypothetical protein
VPIRPGAGTNRPPRLVGAGGIPPALLCVSRSACAGSLIVEACERRIDFGHRRRGRRQPGTFEGTISAPAALVQSLFSRATAIELTECRLPSGRVASLRRLEMRFGNASPDRLREGRLLPTYTAKPLVTFDGAAMFGELAVLRWLEVDGWEGAWLDTFHGRKAWRGMPTTSSPVALPAHAQHLYERIIAENGGRASGTFDIMAWRNGQTIFIEYKGPGDDTKKHESAWVDAALKAGVSENDLLIVAAVDS